jgi:hypothetical protein
MCDAHESWGKWGKSKSTTHGFSTSHTYSTTDGCEPSADAESPLARFALAPEFLAFKELLRRAAQEVSVAQFTALKRYYDSVWLEILGEL